MSQVHDEPKGERNKFKLKEKRKRLFDYWRRNSFVQSSYVSLKSVTVTDGHNPRAQYSTRIIVFNCPVSVSLCPWKASDSCSWLGVEPYVVFCFCSPSTSSKAFPPTDLPLIGCFSTILYKLK
ncbi:hypothetical protein PDJAM_G00189400 [Pangasius djambal]|uniref:Uncharacterized protein n=1 Tax=Pangasius djambal TaxID=1691987 RepID=A0ACC5Y698_9TELE|nr:hypothetical protein [Pangasius djambal]